MGWMDKAKQLAEQAQQKLDETQKQFNTGQQQHQGGGDAVSYDQHGRPSGGTAPVADPTAAPVAQPDPQAPTDEQAQAPTDEQTPPAPAPSGDSPNSTPDPFKPLQ